MTQVVLTRPLESSRELADQLDKHGLSSIVMPLYTFAAREPEVDPGSAWSDPEKRSLAVFTSPRAVRYGLAHIPTERELALEFAVVGAATRRELEKYGYSVHLQAKQGYTSEDLLREPELATEPGQAVIFCAPGGRDALTKGLTALGWEVSSAMVYERLPLLPDSSQVQALSDADDLLSTWTSISALELARESLPVEVWDKILRAPALVISGRIQHHLQQLGANHVLRADGPGNKQLLQSILRLTGRQTNA